MSGVAISSTSPPILKENGQLLLELQGCTISDSLTICFYAQSEKTSDNNNRERAATALISLGEDKRAVSVDTPCTYNRAQRCDRRDAGESILGT